MNLFHSSAFAMTLTTIIACGVSVTADEPQAPASKVLHRTVKIDNLDIFYREAGPKNAPPTLIVWGKNDPIFPAAGAFPYKRDLKNLEFHLLDTGHFALEEDGAEIAALIRDFLDKQPVR